jgi:hypothetical protein
VARTANGTWILLLLALVLAGVLVLGRREETLSRYRADPVLTPGALNPDVTQATTGTTVCVPGWTATIRPPSTYTSDLKAKQLRVYGFPGSPRDYQEDHLVSLGLGGNPTDPRNLWPEPWPRARAVDEIERDLHHRLCAGELSLAEVQRRIAELKHTQG